MLPKNAGQSGKYSFFYVLQPVLIIMKLLNSICAVMPAWHCMQIIYHTNRVDPFLLELDISRLEMLTTNSENVLLFSVFLLMLSAGPTAFCLPHLLLLSSTCSVYVCVTELTQEPLSVAPCSFAGHLQLVSCFHSSLYAITLHLNDK